MRGIGDSGAARNASIVGDDAQASGRVVVRRLGPTDYTRTWRAMQDFTAARAGDTADEIWLTEHPPVYTLGVAGRTEHLLRPTAIPVVRTDRGGQVTYHGPGQLVAYLLLDLRRRRLGARALVREIEAAVVECLATWSVVAHGRVDAPGVYVRDAAGGEAKVASLGLKIRNGCSYHGLALNVSVDLAPFADIDPCGFPGLAVTRLSDLGVNGGIDAVSGRLVAALLNHFAPPPGGWPHSR